MFNQISFFSPAYFAISTLLPSLGDYFFISFFLFYLSVNVYWDFRINEENHPQAGWKISRVALNYLLLTAYGYLIIKLIGLLIYNSSFSFTLNQINEITGPTILGIASMMFLLFSLVLISISTARESRKIISVRYHFLIIIAIVGLSFLGNLLVTGLPGYPIWLLLLSVSLVSLLFAAHTERRYEMSFLVLFISIITVFSIYVIYSITDKKEREVQKLLAITLDAEHDPAAEVFLVEIQQQIKNDPNIRRYLKYPFSNLDKYFESAYFSGFFRQYDLQKGQRDHPSAKHKITLLPVF
jgi:hypothetical protein